MGEKEKPRAAPRGNQNARKHGLYAYQAMLNGDGLDRSLADTSDPHFFLDMGCSLDYNWPHVTPANQANHENPWSKPAGDGGPDRGAQSYRCRLGEGRK